MATNDRTSLLNLVEVAMVGDERLVGFLNRPVVHVALRRERRLLVAANRALIDRLAQRSMSMAR
jgi:hypothetical protein